MRCSTAYMYAYYACGVFEDNRTSSRELEWKMQILYGEGSKRIVLLRNEYVRAGLRTTRRTRSATVGIGL
jgi:hypothetical protein